MTELALELVAIDKSFGGVHALRGADLAARPAEILGLCGENGAGKSTILKILSGVYPRASYGGTVKVRGEERRFTTTRDAEEAGIAIVHQELMLVPELSVAANLVLGRENKGFGGFGGLFGLVDDDAIEANARRLLAKFGVERDIDPSAPVGVLGIGLQQVVEIVRALSQNAKILILDEPTAALTGKETDRLMEWLRGLRDAGTTCIYVSHRMDEIFTICDRITVLRDGKTVGTVHAKTTSPDDVVAMMVGRTMAASKDARAGSLSGNGAGDGKKEPAPVVELRDLSVRLPGIAIEATDGGDDRVRSYAIEKVSLSIQPGEVVAVCGAMGSGRTALLSTIFGCAEQGYTGSIRIGGREVMLTSPRAAIAEGVALIPEDRKGRGLVLGMSVGNNLTLPPARSMLARIFEWIGFVDDEQEELLAKKRIEELRIRGTSAVEVATLSGGNQQKVVIGKWLEMAPNVLLLDEPTRGVDVGAREEIYGLLAELAKSGTAVLLASSDLPEVL
ncbi:MAG: Ribose transport system, ATP-binding protein RbsA, partial [Myxococcaceae bacterium]|nr:Ribose transport system, ATP-binding protein RbsA [Myxococcaceae bacterium]